MIGKLVFSLDKIKILVCPYFGILEIRMKYSIRTQVSSETMGTGKNAIYSIIGCSAI